MPVFISYNHEDAGFADKLAQNLVMNRHHVCMDRWELNVGDSLIEKIQRALTDSGAILVLLAKHSVASEWCKKELNSGLMRELDEKKVLLLPCIIEDCEVPLFLREKLYADFRKDPDAAFKMIRDSLLPITNRQQSRLESPDFHTDWSYDWKTTESGRWHFDFAFVDHSEAIEYSVLTRCLIVCNEVTSAQFEALEEGPPRRQYIERVFGLVTAIAVQDRLKIRLRDPFEQFRRIEVSGPVGEAWFVEISSRRRGIDNGKNTLVYIDQILERASVFMKSEPTPAGQPA